MNKSLEPLSIAKLTYSEFGQLANRLMTDAATIDIALTKDAGYTAYLALVAAEATKYDAGLQQEKENDFTVKVTKADVVRDGAYSALKKAIGLGGESDVVDEVEAARVLTILLTAHGNLQRANYETESIDIDSLLTDLGQTKYKAHVTTLGIGKYVIRLKNGNDSFKTLFSTRIQGVSTATVYDMKAMRKTLTQNYNDTVHYVLTMAKSPVTPNVAYFDAALSLINTERKYYQDNYAHPVSKPPVVVPPVNPTTPTI